MGTGRADDFRLADLDLNPFDAVEYQKPLVLDGRVAAGFAGERIRLGSDPEDDLAGGLSGVADMDDIGVPVRATRTGPEGRLA